MTSRRRRRTFAAWLRLAAPNGVALATAPLPPPDPLAPPDPLTRPDPVAPPDPLTPLANQPLLQVVELRRPPLGPLSLALAVGECLALLGPSGAAKSLLLRAIADLDPHQGQVLLWGVGGAGSVACEALPAPQWRRLVGYLPAEPAWWAETLAEHFVDWPAQAERAEQLGLPGDLGSAAVARLSTGERQRLALLRALEVRPRLLLLDEPTAALDAQATQAVERLLETLRQQGLALLWVTHDPAQAARVSQRQLYLRDGQAQPGPP